MAQPGWVSNKNKLYGKNEKNRLTVVAFVLGSQIQRKVLQESCYHLVQKPRKKDEEEAMKRQQALEEQERKRKLKELAEVEIEAVKKARLTWGVDFRHVRS